MKRSIVTLVAASAMMVAGSAQAAGPGSRTSAVMPASSAPLGQSHAEWTADWWRWLLEHPVAGHPAIPSEPFDISSGQSGPVWNLAGFFDIPTVRSGTVPWGKSLFIMVIGSEWSDLEGYATEEEQRELAAFIADHMHSVYCTVDGVAVDMSGYRFATPQFGFTAPSPWLFGATGGAGNAVADGYSVFVRPLSLGSHVIRFGGTVTIPDWQFEASIDMTYNLTVAP